MDFGQEGFGNTGDSICCCLDSLNAIWYCDLETNASTSRPTTTRRPPKRTFTGKGKRGSNTPVKRSKPIKNKGPVDKSKFSRNAKDSQDKENVQHLPEIHKEDISTRHTGSKFIMPTKDGYYFDIKRLPWKRVMNVTQEHFGIQIHKDKNVRSTIPLINALNGGLTSAIQRALEEIRKTYGRRAFWLTMKLPENSGPIFGHLWLTTDNLRAVALYYTEELEKVLTSKRDLNADKNFNIFIHVMDHLKTEAELKRAQSALNLVKRKRAPKKFHGNEEDEDFIENRVDDDVDDEEDADSEDEDEENEWSADEEAGNVPVGGPFGDEEVAVQSKKSVMVTPDLPKKKMKKKKIKKHRDKQTYLQQVPLSDARFEEDCLITATILGYAYEFQNDDNLAIRNKCQEIVKLDHSKPGKRRKALNAIYEEYKRIMAPGSELSKIPAGKRTLKKCLSILYEIYNCNLIVHSNENEDCLDEIKWRYPLEGPKNDRPTIHILQKMNDTKTKSHCVLIRFIKAYKEIYGQACYYCSARPRSRTIPAFHRCKFKKEDGTSGTCKGCFRYIIPKDEYGELGKPFRRDNRTLWKMTFENPEAPFKTLVFSRHQEIPVNFYCDREGNKNPFPVFHKVKDYGYCGFDIVTKKCEEVHQKTVCKRYFQCLKDCRKIMSIPYNKKHKDMASHDCNNKEIGMCRNCFTYHNFMSLEELCKIRCFKLPQHHPKLGFLSVAFEDSEKSIPNHLLLARETSGNQGQFIYTQRNSYMNQKDQLIATKTWKYKPEHKASEKSKSQNYGNKLILQHHNWLDLVDKAYPKDSRNVLMNYMIEILQDDSFNNTTILSTSDVIQGLLGFHRTVTKGKYQNKARQPKFLEFNNSIRIVDFENYLGIELPIKSKSFFPYINKKEYFNLASAPTIEAYFHPNDTKEERSAKIAFYEKVKDEWTFETAMQTHLLTSVDNLKDHVLKVQNICIDIQNKLKDLTKKKDLNIVSPYSYGSFTQFMYCILQNYILEPNDVRIIRNPPIVGNISKMQYKWERWLKRHLGRKHSRKGSDKKFELFSAFNHINGARRFKNIICDAYEHGAKKVYEYLGTRFHGCKIDKCNILEGLKGKLVDGKENDVLTGEFDARAKHLIDNFNDKVEKVKPYWECLATKKMEEDVDFIQNFKEFPNGIKPHRLSVEDAIYSGALSVYQYLWSKSENDPRRFFFVDINSSYGNVGRTCSFPTGVYNLTLEDDVHKEIKFDNEKGTFVFQKDPNKEVFGLILLDMEPPEEYTDDPFLVYRTKDGRVLNPMCGKCAEDSRTAKPCKHTIDERVLHGTYTFQEAARAIAKYNYRPRRIYEVLTYEKHGPFMEKYFSVLSHFLLKHKEIPEGKPKEEYAKELNDGMGYPKELTLKASEFSQDKFLQDLMKFGTNSVCGRLMKKNDTQKSIPISNESQILGNMENIKGFTLEDERLVAHTENNYGKKYQNPFNNKVLGAYITSYGRLALDDLKTKIKEKGNTIVYTDTDCAMYLGENKLDPELFGNCFGQIKHEVKDAKEIISYVCLGSKRYGLCYITDAGEIKEKSKLSGLRLLADHTGEFCHENLKKLLEDENKQVIAYQYINSRKLKTSTIHETMPNGKTKILKLRRVVKKIRFNPLFHRRIFRKDTFKSVPYGFRN